MRWRPARAALGEAAFAEAFGAGQALSPDDVSALLDELCAAAEVAPAADVSEEQRGG